jgi:glutamate synthase domain-containing protein 1
MARAAGVQPVSWGETLEVFKDVGSPRQICDRYGIPARSGYQAVGHTRMATESAVTTAHSHPFSPAPDLCLVHNGSFSNYFTVRRDLEAEGERFDTDNDSEVGARLISRRLAEGADLGEALETLMTTLDGFYTLLVSTRDQFAVVRDAAACKPAAIAETDDDVAMASEYRALAGLPGIEKAKVFEPMPEEIHLWSR